MVAGALALAGLLVIRVSAVVLWRGLTSGLGLALVVVSALAGVVTMVLVFLGRFGPARVSAALAVAAVIAGWAAAQSPFVLPGLTVAEAAAGRSTLIATIVGVAVGAVVLVPSLTVLYSLVLRGRLDTAVVSDSGAAGSGGVPGAGRVRVGAGGGRSPRVRLAAVFAVAALVAGTGLLVFADPAWAHAIGAAALIACAVTVFALASGPAAELRGQAEPRQRAAGEAGRYRDPAATFIHFWVGAQGAGQSSRHPANVPNHGSVTSPWSGPQQSHIAVVVLGVRSGVSVADGVSGRGAAAKTAGCADQVIDSTPALGDLRYGRAVTSVSGI